MHYSNNIYRILNKNINKHAIKVVSDLNSHGFEAYLVGGGVRDLLLGLKPKDFDIATNAKPEEIRKIFRNCILIGKRFRLAHVRFGKETIEVATFRSGAKDIAQQSQSEHGMLLRDNVYGTMEEDAWRRDFTVNALYYNLSNSSIIDYTNGMKDIKAKKINIINLIDQDATLRYREDPVRMLRAVRLAAKLDFTITKNTADPIKKLAPLLANISPARLFEETIKWFRSGKSLDTFNLLEKYKLFSFLFGQVNTNTKITKNLIKHGLANTDLRINNGKTIIPAFLYAVLLWHSLQDQIKTHKTCSALIIQKSIQQVLQQQKKQTLIPEKIFLTIKEIWLLQYQLIHKKKKMHYVLAHPRFRAGYDFLLLRAQAGEGGKNLIELANWWTQIQEDNIHEKK